jgi:hypothetical protein
MALLLAFALLLLTAFAGVVVGMGLAELRGFGGWLGFKSG